MTTQTVARRQKLPERYETMSDGALQQEIRAIREQLGGRLTILAHHYQRDSIVNLADFRGDSLGLSRQAAQTDSDYIVFCGVRFMAETAAMLCDPEQMVIQPVPEAFCPMAKMGTAGEAAEAWEALTSVWGDDLVPITYQNSTAELKAFVGERGGAVCTSSNARALFEWAFRRKGHILFMPDEHLGTNTALDMGIPEERLGIWNPVKPPDPASLADKQVVVWKGWCSVHTGFSVEDVEEARREYPDATLVVHPECPRAVVERADVSGSTEAIVRVVREAPAGATVVVGTECHLVDRLNQEYPDKQVLPLSRRICGTMAMTQLKHLLYVLDGIVEGEPRNVVQVEESIAEGARLALERMLEAG